VECSDTVLMEIKRSVAMDCMRRPLWMFQRIEDKGTAKHDDDRGGANSALNNPNNPNAATNTNKEPVCEAMNKKQFMGCLHQINPAITTQEVSLHCESCACSFVLYFFTHFTHYSSLIMLVVLFPQPIIIQALDLFQEGLDIAHENVLRCLELMWMRFIDDASHYNHITGTAAPFAHCVDFTFIIAFVICAYRVKSRPQSHKLFFPNVSHHLLYDVCGNFFFF